MKTELFGRCLIGLILGAQLWGERVAAAQEGAAKMLPLKNLVLYSSGVGLFQRETEVEGNAELQLNLKIEDVNDLLKSVVPQDHGGGTVGVVTYESRDPISKTLKAFSLDLTANPTLGQLLEQARGQKIEVYWPGPLTGTIIGVERKQQAVNEKQTETVEYLTLSTEQGLQRIPLASVNRIRLLNEDLNRELTTALELLASSQGTQKKKVTIQCKGEGKRNVSVSYIASMPVWKTTYRLAIEGEGGARLQGWAIVENTTDEDWRGVRLSLVSGRPVSFTMDLYQPLYLKRPEVKLDLFAGLAPEVYSDTVAEPQRARMGRSVAGAPQMAPPQATAALALGDTAKLGEAFRGISLAQGAPPNLATGLEAGELFAYQIDAPVDLPRQRSALLPILNEKIRGEKVSIYNQHAQPKFPLNGYRLTNTSSLYLMQGPLTIFDAGAYAGDARIEDLAAGQSRLISYALDTRVEVSPEEGDGAQRLVQIRISRGVLIGSRKEVARTTYRIKNKDQKARKLVIQHPINSDWELKRPTEGVERARDEYRFVTEVGAGESKELLVEMERTLEEQFELLAHPIDALVLYARSEGLSEAGRKALEEVAARRRALETTRQEIERTMQGVTEITQEQQRIRENMQRLSQNSELYNRYLKKLDEQETEIEMLRKKAANLKQQAAEQQSELEKWIENFEL